MKILLILIITLLSVSCASRKLKKDYEVVDASHQEIPEWVSDLDEWLDDSEKDFEKSRYYIYTSEAKSERSIACEIAKTRASASVASEVSSFIKQSFAQSKEGNPMTDKPSLSEYVEDNLAKEVQAYISGVQNYKEYWEKRKFQKELGALKDYDGFVCSSLVKVSKKNLKRSFTRAQEILDSKLANDNDSKEKVKKIIEEAQKAYLGM